MFSTSFYFYINKNLKHNLCNIAQQNRSGLIMLREGKCLLIEWFFSLQVIFIKF